MGRVACLALVILALGLELVLTVPFGEHNRLKRSDDNERPDFADEMEEYANDRWEEMWGGKCVSDSDCTSYISYCSQDSESLGIVGECRLRWWFILIVVLVVAFLVSSVISCICCPCCFLYNCCRSICDCLCCCCKSDGYSRANTR